MFILGVLAVAVVLAALFWLQFPRAADRADLWQFLARRWRHPPPPEPEPPPPPPPPPPAPVPLRDLAPLFGNIVPILHEREPDLAGTDEFPLQEDIRTRFQELNWRLIVFEQSQQASPEWPVRAFNDFALFYRGPAPLLMEQVHTRLRPRYPVILDWDGHWHAASLALERTPDLNLPLLDAYLGIPPEQRPIIVSRIQGPDTPRTGVLQCLRYGFAEHRFPLDATAPYPTDALTYLFQALTGPAEGWLWFSVARLRHDVLGAHRVQEALRATLEEETAREAAIRHENRFAALWRLRETPAPPEAQAPQPSEVERQTAPGGGTDPAASAEAAS